MAEVLRNNRSSLQLLKLVCPLLKRVSNYYATLDQNDPLSKDGTVSIGLNRILSVKFHLLEIVLNGDLDSEFLGSGSFRPTIDQLLDFLEQNFVQRVSDEPELAVSRLRR